MQKLSLFFLAGKCGMLHTKWTEMKNNFHSSYMWDGFFTVRSFRKFIHRVTDKWGMGQIDLDVFFCKRGSCRKRARWYFVECLLCKCFGVSSFSNLHKEWRRLLVGVLFFFTGLKENGNEQHGKVSYVAKVSGAT